MPRAKTPRTGPLPSNPNLTPRQREVFRKLAAEWDRKLAVLQEPDARKRMDEVLASHGRFLPRPKAGSSF